LVSWLQKPTSPKAIALSRRLVADGRPVAVTMVSFVEQLRGRLAKCVSAKSPEEFVDGLRLLRRTIEEYQRRTILDFDDRAVTEFKKLKGKVRVGTMDLRIASVVLAVGGKLLSANLSDFRKVPGLDVEDWSAA
jgi:tRNA(fMet)-specific endonuclease VapC